jgi:hypothetical protein
MSRLERQNIVDLQYGDLAGRKSDGSLVKFFNEDNFVRTYKVYTALLTQTGDEDPVVVELENTIGDISITYNAAGTYIVQGATFSIDKTYVSPYGFSPLLDLPDGIWSEVDGTDIYILSISNADRVDGQLLNTPLEIRLYN